MFASATLCLQPVSSKSKAGRHGTLYTWLFIYRTPYHYRYTQRHYCISHLLISCSPNMYVCLCNLILFVYLFILIPLRLSWLPFSDKFLSVAPKTATENRIQIVDSGMSSPTSACHKISTSSLFSSQVSSVALVYYCTVLDGCIFCLSWTHSACLYISGQCWAHQSCALWSEGVCQGEGQSLLNVDRAIDSGSTKVSHWRKSAP